jgi:hypothetical protein
MMALLFGTFQLAAQGNFESENSKVSNETPKETQPKVYTKDELIQKAYYYADLHKVSRETMVKVINCENRDWIPNLQSGIINKKGERERSFGLAQIHLPSWKNISYEQATNPDFSLNFMAEKLAEGKGNLWTCYRKLKNTP